MFRIQILPLTPRLLHLATAGMPPRNAMISIMDHKRDAKERYPSPGVLRLCFDDATETSFWQNLMTIEQADAIASFAWNHKDDIDLLIVHCTEGVSRSAAVAAGILNGLGEDESWIWKNGKYRPNLLVYALVKEAFQHGKMISGVNSKIDLQCREQIPSEKISSRAQR